MSTANLRFAKVVATPTPTAWSQVYNTGSFFTALSLSTDMTTEDEDLPAIGKELFSALQSEIFTLEKKDLSTLKEAITTALQDLPEGVLLSLSVTFIKDNVLYAFVKGGGRITLKRQGSIGAILQQTEGEQQLVSASGYLEMEDLVVLETAQFVKAIPANILMEALDYDLPTDVAETISPHIHNADTGGASALVVSFQGTSPSVFTDTEDIPQTPDTTEDIPDEEAEPTPEETTSEPHIPEGEEAPEQQRFSFPSVVASKGKLLLSSVIGAVNLRQGRKKLFLGLAVLLTAFLIFSLFLARQSKEQQAAKQLFNQVYPQAEKKYEIGQGLSSINQPLANENFRSSKDELEKLQGKFKPGSAEYKQVASLQEKLDQRLAGVPDTDSAQAQVQKVSADKVPLLHLLTSQDGAQAVTSDDDNYYVLTGEAIKQISKNDKTAQTKITNDSDWKDPVALGIFSSNLYVLDADKGLLKFVPVSDGYTKTSYFKSDSPDFSHAVSMAIDGSIYFLFSDGSITKYTRGEKDIFTLEGLDTKIKSPKALFTTADLSSLYVLDSGNSRLIRVSKTGNVQKTYQSSLLNKATALQVSDDGKDAFFLSEGKIYQLSL